MKTFKKVSLYLLLGFMLISAKSYSQDYNNVIKANPLGLAFGNFNVTY